MSIMVEDKIESPIDVELLLKAYRLMYTAKSMAVLYEENVAVTAKYVHATSRGHEAIQLAVSMQLLPKDYLSAYYRDDSMLLGIGLRPYELMLQLLAKRDDPFSGGRTYYSHPSLKREDMPKIPHQSSATGMQAIPATGVAMGIQYLLNQQLLDGSDGSPIVVCSLGDASVTEGEVAEAFQMAALKQFPIIYVVQDNEWDISATAAETRTGNAFEYAKGFKGLEAVSIDGTDFITCYKTIERIIASMRKEAKPWLVHARVPLLNHHTSGVRKEWYRTDLEEAALRDPLPRYRNELLELGIAEADLLLIEAESEILVKSDYQLALAAEDPRPEDLFTHDFAPTPISHESGERSPAGGEQKVMVDCALFAIQELMNKHPECLLYGQDVGERLGGVFREAATLAKKFGGNRVFNTPIQEAFIIGSTVGMSATGCKPIVEVQFADYIWPGLNQLFTEVSRSCYLSNGKWPVSSIIRVPIGAYGSGGPYHSSSVESVLTNIRGIKICYPSTGADLKGLLKAAYYDPNPVVMLEHKGLYWSKIKGTEEARSIEPSEDYVLPIGKARVVQNSNKSFKNTITIITYGMGVYWSMNAAKSFEGLVEVIDLRTLAPLDEEAIFDSVKSNNKCLVVTEEPVNNSFGQALAGRIQQTCFKYLDAPVAVIGAENMPAIPLNSILEQTMLPSTSKVEAAIKSLLDY
jgi:2-oxoisovalerate dehydrogenase E1 component